MAWILLKRIVTENTDYGKICETSYCGVSVRGGRLLQSAASQFPAFGQVVFIVFDRAVGYIRGDVMENDIL